eukprot:4245022-Amphidinium_carterae.1
MFWSLNWKSGFSAQNLDLVASLVRLVHNKDLRTGCPMAAQKLRHGIASYLEDNTLVGDYANLGMTRARVVLGKLICSLSAGHHV